jgi:hypothetical protein
MIRENIFCKMCGIVKRTNFQKVPTIGCSFKFPIKVGVEESIVNALRITDHGSAA